MIRITPEFHSGNGSSATAWSYDRESLVTHVFGALPGVGDLRCLGFWILSVIASSRLGVICSWITINLIQAMSDFLLYLWTAESLPKRKFRARQLAIREKQGPALLSSLPSPVLSTEQNNDPHCHLHSPNLPSCILHLVLHQRAKEKRAKKYSTWL